MLNVSMTSRCMFNKLKALTRTPNYSHHVHPSPASKLFVTHFGMRLNRATFGTFFSDEKEDMEEIYSFFENKQKKKQSQSQSQSQTTSKMITDANITLPHQHIRQFIGLIHPDRCEAMINQLSLPKKNEQNEKNGHNSSSSSSTDTQTDTQTDDMVVELHDIQQRLKQMKTCNSENLSQLNALLEFSRKQSKVAQKELLMNKNKNTNANANATDSIPDRKLTENVPNPMLFEFYVISNQMNNNSNDPNTNMAIMPIMPEFRKIRVRFDCKEKRPLLSEFFEYFNATFLCQLFASNVGADVGANDNGNIESSATVKKFNDSDIQKAMHSLHGGDNAQEQQQLMFEQAVNHNIHDGKQYAMQMLNTKFNRNKIRFHPELSMEEQEIVMDMLFNCCEEYSIDLLLETWMEVPIVVCCNDVQCFECPAYCVVIPWYIECEEFVFYIQQQIMQIVQDYKHAVRVKMQNAQESINTVDYN